MGDGASAQNPVGVFDSGVGGLSVLREIRRELPAEELFYVADSGYAPYGDKPGGVIQQRAIEVVRFLIGQGSKAVVVASNTATGVAVEALRAQFSIPLVGIEPAVKPAVLATKSGVVGVLATTQTLASTKFARLLHQFGKNVQVLTQACPGLVEQVEQGDFDGERTRSLVEQYVRPLVEKGADIIVLGCTHYPFLSAAIQSAAGAAVTVIDPAVAVAREVRRVLDTNHLLSPGTENGAERFWTSGAPSQVAPLISQLWGKRVKMEAL
jgi:glutamate racemase